ncbi:MAG: hypothetical protein ACREMS_00970 [Gemmatimonadaceae bacterium]
MVSVAGATERIRTG